MTNRTVHFLRAAALSLFAVTALGATPALALPYYELHVVGEITSSDNLFVADVGDTWSAVLTLDSSTTDGNVDANVAEYMGAVRAASFVVNGNDLSFPVASSLLRLSDGPNGQMWQTISEDPSETDALMMGLAGPGVLASLDVDTVPNVGLAVANGMRWRTQPNGDANPWGVQGEIVRVWGVAVAPPSNPVPEPSAALVFAMGLGLVARTRRGARSAG